MPGRHLCEHEHGRERHREADALSHEQARVLASRAVEHGQPDAGEHQQTQQQGDVDVQALGEGALIVHALRGRGERAVGCPEWLQLAHERAP